MKIAFTGPAVILSRDYSKLDALFTEIASTLSKESDEVITGACIGLDAFAAWWFHTQGYKVHTIVPANTSKVDEKWQRHCSTHEFASDGKEPYRIRNTIMVTRCDELVGVYYTYPARNGETMTINIAKRQGKPVREAPLC